VYIALIFLKEIFMKKAFLMMMIFGVGLQAQTSIFTNPKEAKVCEALYEQAEENCAEYMCEEAEAEGYDCIRDGDFQVGLQICVSEGEFESLIEEHNKKNSSNAVACEQE